MAARDDARLALPERSTTPGNKFTDRDLPGRSVQPARWAIGALASERSPGGGPPSTRGAKSASRTIDWLRGCWKPGWHGMMFVTIRRTTPAPSMRFRLQTGLDATLLELCCQTAERLGALCPAAGFHLSMNNRDALGGGDSYLSSLKDLGVRHADILYVLNGPHNPRALLAAVQAVIDSRKLPITSPASTQTVPPNAICNATQTPGRPFPSDTGTQTEIQGVCPGHTDAEINPRSYSVRAHPDLEWRNSPNLEHEHADGQHEELDDLPKCERSTPVRLPAPGESQHTAMVTQGESHTHSSAPATWRAFDTEAQAEQDEGWSPYGPPRTLRYGQTHSTDWELAGEDVQRCPGVSSSTHSGGQGERTTTGDAYPAAGAYLNNSEAAECADEDSDGLSPRSEDTDGGTAFLPSTQTPESQQTFGDRKRCATTPPLSLSLSLSLGDTNVGGIRKRLCSSPCQTQ